MTPAVRQRHHAAPDARRSARPAPTSSPPGPLIRAASVRPRSAASSRMDLQRAAVRAACQRGQVVHPAVVRPQVPSADQHEVVARSRRQRRAQPLGVGDQQGGRQLDLARRRAQHLGRAAAAAAPKSMPCGASLSRCRVRPSGLAPKRVAVRAEPQHHVEPALVAAVPAAASPSARRPRVRPPASRGRRSPWPASPRSPARRPAPGRRRARGRTSDQRDAATGSPARRAGRRSSGSTGGE